MTIEPQASTRAPTYTPEEQRRINEQWMEMHIARYQALRKKYEVLESQLQQIARHVGLDPKDLDGI